jgi:hypothetical protein
MRGDYFSVDNQEFLYLLYKYDVKYLIIGGEAVIYYGNPRLTGDIDFFYKNEKGNVEALYKALQEFWDYNIPGIDTMQDLQLEGYVIQFGVPPNRIDLLNNIEAVSFKEAWPDRIVEKIKIKGETIAINFIGLSHLKMNKRAAGRNKDKDDLDYLNEL